MQWFPLTQNSASRFRVSWLIKDEKIMSILDLPSSIGTMLAVCAFFLLTHLEKYVTQRILGYYEVFSVACENFFLAIWDTSHWNFFANFDTRHLMTSPRTIFHQIWNMLLFGDSRAIQVHLPKLGAFRKSIFSQWRSSDSSMRLGVLGGQIPGLYGGTIFGGVQDTWGLWWGFEYWRFCFEVVF